MTAAEYIISFLINKGVTDIFGIPGGVILDILYAAENSSGKLKPRLSYHEQGAAMAACGYAQISNRLGVAYATRGPGFTNMLTAVADAYYDSIPVLFITAHSAANNPNMRAEHNQEMDTVALVSKITKYAKRVNSAKDVQEELDKAYTMATSGRKGPVFLDFSAQSLSQKIDVLPEQEKETVLQNSNESEAVKHIINAVSKAKRPVLLIGDGIHQSNTEEFLTQFVEKNDIPVISSRFSLDILGNSDKYFGYVGSHAIRCANFMLSKADLLLSLGNRLNFPLNSASYAPLTHNLQIIRIDSDKSEFLHDIPNTNDLETDLKDLMPALCAEKIAYNDAAAWLRVCRSLKTNLVDTDMTEPVEKIAHILAMLDKDTSITSDVGNNEFWLARAYIYQKCSNRILFSKSFGALGCSLPKAIGACYATKKPVACFTGDQGLQMNMQELQCVAQNQLPIKIIVVNNHTSGMIKDRQAQKYGSHFIHTTRESGYSALNLAKLAQVYNLDYISLSNTKDYAQIPSISSGIIELNISDDVSLKPTLKKGDLCQNLFPYLQPELYNKLNAL